MEALVTASPAGDGRRAAPAVSAATDSTPGAVPRTRAGPFPGPQQALSGPFPGLHQVLPGPLKGTGRTRAPAARARNWAVPSRCTGWVLGRAGRRWTRPPRLPAAAEIGRAH